MSDSSRLGSMYYFAPVHFSYNRYAHILLQAFEEQRLQFSMQYRHSRMLDAQLNKESITTEEATIAMLSCDVVHFVAVA